MIIESKAQLTTDKREELPLDRNRSAFLCQHSTMMNFPDQTIPWHWHNQLEISYMEHGSIEFSTLDRKLVLEEGQAVFFSPDVMHSLKNVHADGKDACFAFFFDRSFISGGMGTEVEEKYVRPVLENGNLKELVFDCEKDLEIMKDLKICVALCRDEPEGYEFALRTEFTRIWMQIFRKSQNLAAGDRKKNREDETRIRQMISFIWENYKEAISVPRIAEAAEIGPRECSRCFKRTLQMSPAKYLNLYRLQKAADLLMDSKESITEIALTCGFSSTSYFAESFKAHFHCTPHEYRS